MAVSKTERARREELATQGLKHCPRCQEVKPFAVFPHDRTRPDGLGCWCLSCAQANGQRWYKEKKQDAAWLAGRRGRDLLAHKRAYKPHPVVRSEEDKRRSRERRRYYRQKWAAAHRERILSYYQRYRDAHPERREVERQRGKAHYRTDSGYRGRRVLLSQKRRTIVRAGVTTLTTAELQELRQLPCMFCGATEDLTIAHDVPVSRGGNTTRGNVFVLCRRCNSMMGTRTLAQMVEQQSLL